MPSGHEHPGQNPLGNQYSLPAANNNYFHVTHRITTQSTKIKKFNKKYKVFLQSFAMKHYHQISGNPELHFQKWIIIQL